MNTVPNRFNLIVNSTMQGLGLDNNERKKTMNSNFTLTANSDIIQSPVAFEPTEDTLNGASPIIKSFPLVCLRINEDCFPMSRICLNMVAISIFLLSFSATWRRISMGIKLLVLLY